MYIQNFSNYFSKYFPRYLPSRKCHEISPKIFSFDLPQAIRRIAIRYAISKFLWALLLLDRAGARRGAFAQILNSQPEPEPEPEPELVSQVGMGYAPERQVSPEKCAKQLSQSKFKRTLLNFKTFCKRKCQKTK